MSFLLLPPPDQVQMQVKNNLPTALLNIKKQAIAGFCDIALCGHIPGFYKHLGQDGPIRILNIINAANMLFRDN